MKRSFIVWTKTDISKKPVGWEPSYHEMTEREAVKCASQLRNDCGIPAKALPVGVRPGEDLPTLFVNPERMAEWGDPT